MKQYSEASYTFTEFAALARNDVNFMFSIVSD
jgi:hypothetical protein